MFELEEVAGQEAEANSTVIKVVGVGGAGGNAVDHMIREGVSGVEFICCNTDAQALKKSNARTVKLQLGPGLGAGGKPEKARALADVERERIAEALRAPTWPSSPPAWAAAPAPAPADRRRGGARAGHPDRGGGDQALRVREGKRKRVAEEGWPSWPSTSIP
jgi:hypothetical protein